MPTNAPACVLGFDPGFGRLGAALIEKKNGKEVLLFSTCFTTPKDETFDKRFRRLSQAVAALIARRRPDAVAIEKVYLSKNKKTAMGVAEVRGMLRHLAGVHRLPLFEYGPGEVKIAVTGYGASDKKAVEAMVRRLVAFPAGAGRLDDEIDAVAIALTCLASTNHPTTNY